MLTSVPYYLLPAIVLPFASFLALWQRSSGNATKSPRIGGMGHTLIWHDEVMMYDLWSKGVSLTCWLIRLNVSKDASHHEAAANSPVETEDSHSSVPLSQPSNEKVWAFLDEILSAFLSSKKHILQYSLWFCPLLYLIQVLDSNGQQSKTIVWSFQLPQHMKNGGGVQ